MSTNYLSVSADSNSDLSATLDASVRRSLPLDTISTHLPLHHRPQWAMIVLGGRIGPLAS